MPMSTAPRPAAYASWSPSRNEDWAAAVVCVAYCGLAAARSSALAYDSWSWLWVVAVTSCPDAAMAFPMAAAYPAVSKAPKIDVMNAPPRSRCRSAVPDAMPTRRTGTDPVNELDDGVPASPTPMPMSASGMATNT